VALGLTLVSVPALIRGGLSHSAHSRSALRLPPSEDRVGPLAVTIRVQILDVPFVGVRVFRDMDSDIAASQSPFGWPRAFTILGTSRLLAAQGGSQTGDFVLRIAEPALQTVYTVALETERGFGVLRWVESLFSCHHLEMRPSPLIFRGPAFFCM
jgi:hypothetical protein